jgi:hypothetical protein
MRIYQNRDMSVPNILATRFFFDDGKCSKDLCVVQTHETIVSGYFLAVGDQLLIVQFLSLFHCLKNHVRFITDNRGQQRRKRTRCPIATVGWKITKA